jgi:asparagine synthase (glutamine-hydrolysing)
VLREAVKGLVPEAIRLRVTKLGFQPPQESWMHCPEMRGLVAEARTALVSERIIRPRLLSPGSEWKVLMTWLLLRHNAAR